MPDTSIFTRKRVFSIDGSRMYAPPLSTMIPYSFLGPGGGIFWADSIATASNFSAEKPRSTLTALGFDALREFTGIHLGLIMAGVYDGYDEDTFYWLVNPPVGNDPVENLKQQLQNHVQIHARWTDKNARLAHAGRRMLHVNPTDLPTWWTKVTIWFSNGNSRSYGFKDQIAVGSADTTSLGGLHVQSRSIPNDAADHIFNDGKKTFFSMFNGEIDPDVVEFSIIEVRYMGGDNGLQIVHSILVTRQTVLMSIYAHPYMVENTRAVTAIQNYLSQIDETD